MSKIIFSFGRVFWADINLSKGDGFGQHWLLNCFSEENCCHGKDNDTIFVGETLTTSAKPTTEALGFHTGVQGIE